MESDNTLRATCIALDQLAIVSAGFDASTKPELRLKVANCAVRLAQALTRDPGGSNSEQEEEQK